MIYCRVSTKEQVEEGNSLASQTHICQEYAIRSNYVVKHIFLERGESAKTDNRTELQKLIEYCKQRANKVEVVIVHKIDRWARHHLDYGTLKETLKRYGVIIQSATENLEDTPAGRFMENVLASQAQFDNEVRAERCAGGMKDAMREGRYVWMAPIGYDNAKIDGRSTIMINPQKGMLMRKGFQMIASNTYTVEHVRKILTDEGLTGRKNKPLSKAYFYKAFSNELYCGVIKKFGETHTGTFEPIVSKELFDQVQRVLKHKGRKNVLYKRYNEDFPLRRFVLNNEGKKITGSWSKGCRKKYPYYRFGGKGSNYSRDKLEAHFMQFMDSFAFNKSELKKLVQFVEKYIVKADKDTHQRIELLKKEVADLQQKQSGLISKNLNGVISDAVLKTHLDLIETRIMDIGAEIVSYTEEKIDTREAVAYIKEYLEKPSKIWVNAKLPTKLALQKFQFPSGVVFENYTFGTTKIASVFKAKNEILHSNSTVVDSRADLWNKQNTNEKKSKSAWETLHNSPNSKFKNATIAEFRKSILSIYRILNHST